MTAFFLRVARGEPARAIDVLEGFRIFAFSWKLYLWFLLYLLPWIALSIALSIAAAVLILNGLGGAVWGLGLMALAILPACLQALRYGLFLFVAADEPEVAARDCVRRSRELMRGNMGRAVLFCLRGLLWMLAGLIAFVVGVLWAYAYVGTAYAHFYDDLRAQDRDAASPAESAPM